MKMSLFKSVRVQEFLFFFPETNRKRKIVNYAYGTYAANAERFMAHLKTGF